MYTQKPFSIFFRGQHYNSVFCLGFFFFARLGFFLSPQRTLGRSERASEREFVVYVSFYFQGLLNLFHYILCMARRKGGHGRKLRKIVVANIKSRAFLLRWCMLERLIAQRPEKYLRSIQLLDFVLYVPHLDAISIPNNESKKILKTKLSNLNPIRGTFINSVTQFFYLLKKLI